MSDHRTRIQADSGLNPLDARVALALAFWAYPHENREKAEKVIFYPKVWEPETDSEPVP